MKNILRTFSAIGFALAAVIAGMVGLMAAQIDSDAMTAVLVGLFALVGALAGWYRVK
jgi:hypothetical protein